MLLCIFCRNFQSFSFVIKKGRSDRDNRKQPAKVGGLHSTVKHKIDGFR